MIAGSDMYGAVKRVGGTPVVTRFWMLSFLPLWPRESYYSVGIAATRVRGVPFLAQTHEVEVQGFPLERLDRLSVAVAYLRGLCGALVTFGSMVIVPGIMVLTGSHLDDFAIKATTLSAGCLVAGVLLGAGSYLWPIQITRRERDIRCRCGKVLGPCIDPARVRRDLAAGLAKRLDGPTREARMASPRPSAGTPVEPGLLLQLVRTRLELALGGPRGPLEDETDRLLETLRIREGEGLG